MEMPWDRTILGIDQSLTSTGVCVGGNGHIDFMDVIKTKPNKDDPLGDFKRCMEISDKIIQIANHFMVDHVFIEDLSFGSTGRATRQLSGLLYIIVENLMKEGYTVSTVAPTTLKKFAVGKGNCGKPEMFDALPDHAKHHVRSFPKGSRDDVTDAYWLCQFDGSVE